MSDAAFLTTIRDSPTDDTPRLVYADWLDERGDLRGEFLRTGVAARKAEAGHPDLPRMARRLAVLRATVPPLWVRRAYSELAEDDVREAVFREMLGDGPCFDTFVRVECDRDPSPYLYALLAESRAELQPASAGELREGGYYDKRTGFHGCMISIDGLEWAAEDVCSVVGGFFHDGLAAQGNVLPGRGQGRVVGHT